MSFVILEGVNLTPAGSLAAKYRTRPRLSPADLRQLLREIRMAGTPSADSLAKLRGLYPAVAQAWDRWFALKGATPAGTLQGLNTCRKPWHTNHPSRHRKAAACGLLGDIAPNALTEILGIVPDGKAAKAYYERLPEIHAIDNLPREKGWVDLVDKMVGLVRRWVKSAATREEVEELTLRVGLAADAAGNSIVPDRKTEQFSGARQAGWMGGAIGYGGVINWNALQSNAKQYLDQGFQWPEIFGRWSDPPNSRTLANDSGVYPYLPTWAQALAAKAWRNRRIIQVENASRDGHETHAYQRSQSWDAQMEPVNPNMKMGGLQAADAVIAAGVAANQVLVDQADSTYQAPWEVVRKPAAVASSSTGATMQFKDAGDDYGNSNGNGGGDVILRTLNLPGGIPTMTPIVDHAPPPVFEVPAPSPIHATVQASNVGVQTTGPVSASAVGAQIPASSISTMSPVPPGAQSLTPVSQAQLQAMAQAQAQAEAQAAGGSWFDQEMIPGVSNKLLAGGAAALLVVLFMMRRD